MKLKGKIIILTGALYLALLGFVPGANATIPTSTPSLTGGPAAIDPDLQIRAQDIGFQIPTFEDFLSFMVRFFFVIAGLLALFYMLWGAISWVTSGGDKDAVGKARDKIVAAVIGVLLIIATLAIIAGLEQIVFKGRMCFGVTCKLTLPTLLKCPDGSVPNPTTGRCPGDPADSGVDSNGGLAQGSQTGSSSEEVAGAQAGSANNGSVNGGSNGETSGSNNGATGKTGSSGESGSASTEGTSVKVVLPATGL